MALKIRLARAGAKKRPFYRIVVADSRSPRDGRFIEKLGTYNPLLPKDNDNRVNFDSERVKHWLDRGAKPTDRVARFLSTQDLVKWQASNNPEKAKPKAKAQERMREAEEAAKAAAEEAAAAAEAPAEEAAAEEAPAEEAPAEEAPAEEAPAEEEAKEG